MDNELNYQNATLKDIAKSIKEQHILLATLVYEVLAINAGDIACNLDKPDYEYEVAEKVAELFEIYMFAYQVCRKVTAYHYLESLKIKPKKYKRRVVSEPAFFLKQPYQSFIQFYLNKPSARKKAAIWVSRVGSE